MHSSEVWWHFSRCIIHGTHLFSRQLPPPTFPLCFVFCHVPSPCYNYSLQGPSIHCDRAPLWWSGLCLSLHSWTIWMQSKSPPAGVPHFCTFFSEKSSPKTLFLLIPLNQQVADVKLYYVLVNFDRTTSTDQLLMTLTPVTYDTC